MMQRVGTAMETKSEYDEDGQRSEEAECWVREDSRNLWESPIPLGSQEPSWEKAPVEKLNTLQRNHQNAELGPSEMPIQVKDVMALLSHQDLVKDLEATYKYSKWGAVLAGASAFVGGVLGGPPGIFIGGSVGGLIGWITSRRRFKSVPQILKELPAAEKQKLCAEVKAIVKNLQWKDAPQLIRLVLANPTIRRQVVAVLARYLNKMF